MDEETKVETPPSEELSEYAAALKRIEESPLAKFPQLKERHFENIDFLE